jgi:preprotein translocase subunit SecF
MRLLKLIPDNTNIGFLRWRWVAMGITLALMAASIALLATRGLNYGVDFAGGLTLQVGFDEAAPVDEIRSTVNGLGIGEATIQEFGSPQNVAIRVPLEATSDPQAIVGRVFGAIKAAHPDATLRSQDTVSGKVSGELIRDGALAALLAMAGVAAFIWLRFEWQFGVGALFALVHDVVLTLGFFALTQLEFNLNIVAAVLTIIGYSLNDTIVVYDRVRENLRKFRKMDIQPLLDLTVNETLSRTMVTSISMILALSALVLLGGDVIFGFAIAMLLGIFVGTYSSIYIAAPMLIWLGVTGATFAPVEAGKAERVG